MLTAVALAGAVAAGGGCGGAGDAGRHTQGSRPSTVAGPPPAQRPTRRLLVAALGDSITAGSPMWDPDPAVRRRAADTLNDQSQYEYWAQRRLGPLVSFRNCGVFGETTAQIARRLDGCARGAQVLIVQGGINDVYRPVPVQRSAANLRAIVRRGKALGLAVELTDVLPWNNGYPRFAGKIDCLNALIGRLGRTEHVPVLGFHAVLADPANPQLMRADWTNDGDHPNVIGYRRLGYAVELPRVGPGAGG